MRYAILAAGEGSRLSNEGVNVPKPLVKIGKERLIDRLIRIFLDCGARDISVVINDFQLQTYTYLSELVQQGAPLHFIVKTTPSSMHSLYALSPFLQDDEPFVLTTVDTVFSEDEFKSYVSDWQHFYESGDVEGLMGVTDYIDDEKPLYVDADANLMIRAFLDETPEPHYVSGGIYGLTRSSLQTLHACIIRGESRMRNFQRALLVDGRRLKAWPFTQVFDIDHAKDIEKAESFFCI